MANYEINGEAIKLKRAVGSNKGSGRWRNGRICMLTHRTPEITNMRGESSLNICLIHSQYGR